MIHWHIEIPAHLTGILRRVISVNNQQRARVLVRASAPPRISPSVTAPRMRAAHVV
jgi:hypothetical protein